jgi:HK97 family phage major capsid protein
LPVWQYALLSGSDFLLIEVSLKLLLDLRDLLTHRAEGLVDHVFVKYDPAGCQEGARSPTDWSKLRRSKDSQNRYLVSPDPTRAEASSLWGIDVVQTTTCPAGTALVAAAQLGAQAYIRQGVTIESTPFNGTDWTNNVTRFRAEERLVLATPRPSALCKVTGL